MRLQIRWMIRTFGVAALVAVTQSVAPAQMKEPPVPPKSEGKTPGPIHPATGNTTTGGTKTPAVIPHPGTTTPHPSTTTPATPHPGTGTTTIKPDGTTTTVISPNSTTVVSPHSTTTTGTTPASARVTLPPYNPATSINANPFLSTGTGFAGNSLGYNPYFNNPYSLGVQPFLNNSPYYQLSLQYGLRSPSPYATDPYLAINNFYSPFANPYIYYSMMNPYSGYNPYLMGINPFNPFANSLAMGTNPYLPFVNPLNPLVNSFAMNSLLGNASPFGFFGPGLVYTPPVAVQQPGALIREGPNLAVNPVTGTVVLPRTGIATMADGSTFYRLSQTPSPVYYNPLGGTFFNPLTGVVARPGQVNVVGP